MMNWTPVFLMAILPVLRCALFGGSPEILVLPTVEHVGIVGGLAIFNCLPRSNVLISGVHWTVNGSLLEAQDLPNVVAEFSPIGNGLGTLLINDLSEFFNNTLIGCIATVDSVEISSSNEPILLVQGLLVAVGSLQVEESGSEIFLMWDAPFTLDDLDITYIVRIFVVNTSLITPVSEHSIVSTEFNYSRPYLDICDRILNVVVPVNEAGNGEESEISYFIPQSGPMIETTSRISSNSGVFTYMLDLSDGVCSGEMVVVDINTGESVTIEEIYFNIDGDRISVTTEQLTNNRLCNCSLMASNQGGSSLSLFMISLHDVQNIEIELSSTAVIVTATYSEHSTARGVLFRFLFVMDDGSVDYTKSPLIVLDRSAPPGYMLPFNLYAGSYLAFAHDIESDGTLQDGVGFPAVTHSLSARGNRQGPFFLVTLQLNCQINSPPGTIRVQCSSPYGSMTTGFQVMAHLSNSSASSKVYVKRSINLLTPAEIQVEESGTYHIVVFARREEGEILNSTGEYYGLVMVAMKDTTGETTAAVLISLTIPIVILAVILIILIPLIPVIVYGRKQRLRRKIQCSEKSGEQYLPLEELISSPESPHEDYCKDSNERIQEVNSQLTIPDRGTAQAIVVGSSGSGKSSLVSRLFKRPKSLEFSPSTSVCSTFVVGDLGPSDNCEEVEWCISPLAQPELFEMSSRPMLTLEAAKPKSSEDNSSPPAPVACSDPEFTLPISSEEPLLLTTPVALSDPESEKLAETRSVFDGSSISITSEGPTQPKSSKEKFFPPMLTTPVACSDPESVLPKPSSPPMLTSSDPESRPKLSEEKSGAPILNSLVACSSVQPTSCKELTTPVVCSAKSEKLAEASSGSSILITSKSPVQPKSSEEKSILPVLTTLVACSDPQSENLAEASSVFDGSSISTTSKGLEASMLTTPVACSDPESALPNPSEEEPSLPIVATPVASLDPESTQPKLSEEKSMLIMPVACSAHAESFQPKLSEEKFSPSVLTPVACTDPEPMLSEDKCSSPAPITCLDSDLDSAQPKSPAAQTGATQSASIEVADMGIKKDKIVRKNKGFQMSPGHVSLYLREAGGQPQFQEMISLMVFGPSLFLFVFRIDLQVDSKSDSVNEGKSASSNTSIEEDFLQCLASVYAIDSSDKAGVKMCKPRVLVIGTYKDKICDAYADKKIAKLNEHFKSLIEKNGFQNLVCYADDSKGQVMFTVDNTSKDDEDFIPIRSKVHKLIREESTKWPISYLVFCADLHNQPSSVLSLDQFKAIAAKYGVKGREVFNLIYFLYLQIGAIHVHNLKGLGQIVVKSHFLFSIVDDLLTNILTEEYQDFKKGILTASVFRNVVSNETELTPEKFVSLLEHLHIIAPIPGYQEKRYFMPCLLKHVEESKEQEIPTDISPLSVRFQCSLCPKGLFSMLITHLMTPESDGESDSHISFTLNEDKIFTDKVSFRFSKDEFSLKMFASHLEVKFFPCSDGSREKSIGEACRTIREAIETSIFKSLDNLHYSKCNAKPMMFLMCEFCSQLHEVEKGENFHTIYCNQDRISSRIPSQGRWWFNEDSDSAITMSTSKQTDSGDPSGESSMSEKWAEPRPNKAKKIFQEFPDIPTVRFGMERFRMLIKVLSEACAEWKGIGLCLEIPEKKMANLGDKWKKHSNRGLISIVDEWLKGNYKEKRLYPCWKSVVFIMADEIGGRNPAAARILAENWKKVEEDPFYGCEVATTADNSSLHKLYERRNEFLRFLFSEYLHEVEEVWFEIGVLLGVPFSKLEEIDKEHKLMEVISAWMDLYLPEPTIQVLVDAVAHTMGGNNRDLARRIADNVHFPSSVEKHAISSAPPDVRPLSVSLKYPIGSHLDTFNEMLPAIRVSVVGSVDALCSEAISRNLLTFSEKACILEEKDVFKKVSCFLNHFALKIEVSHEVWFQFIDMLTNLRTCGELIEKLKCVLAAKAGVVASCYSTPEFQQHHHQSQRSRPHETAAITCDVEAMTVDQLYSWLLHNGMPMEDCQLIKDKEMNGMAFSSCSEEEWKIFGISSAGLIILKKQVYV